MTDKELREEVRKFIANFYVHSVINTLERQVLSLYVDDLLSLFKTYSKKREEERIEEIRAYLDRASKQFIKDSAWASPGKGMAYQERASCCRDLRHILKYQYEVTILGGKRSKHAKD